MSSAKIYHFPRSARRRPVPLPVRYAARPYSRPGASGFALLLMVTLVAAFLYLSGAADVARHDVLYAALLAAVWGLYFMNDKLLRTRVGSLLARVGQFLLLAGFFGGIYWLIRTSS
ncbi:MAG TPA: hypothetical protein VN688_07800 [Gemmataceae bacterium]|nr:hypothetical protein [Gemmataceae bacterium]